jgi:hypothetical protein
MTQNGKGSNRRPTAVPRETFHANWDKIFANREPPIEYTNLLRSGMFFELYPQLSGMWELDKPLWFALQPKST